MMMRNERAKQDIHESENVAVELFLGDGTLRNPSHLAFKTWYHPDICHYLLQMSDNQAQCIRVIFPDAGYGNNTQTFKNQLQTLIVLGNKIQKNAIFISKEPGADNHFICGLIRGNQLLLINPLGITTHLDCYKTLAELQKENTITHLWLSSQPLQQRAYEGEGLYSCGPITLELATHILANMTAEQIDRFWKNTLEVKEPTTHELTGLVYFGTAITSLLSPLLLSLLNSENQIVYREQVLQLRQKHYEQLTLFPSLLAKEKDLSVSDYLEHCKNEAPAQVVFNALVTQHKQAYNVQELLEYTSLENELKNPITFLKQKQLTQFKSEADAKGRNEGSAHKSTLLLKIDYNREELIEIIDELKVGDDIRSQIDAYVNTIEEKVSEIHRYQSKKKVENFYPSMREALLSIRNTANALYELIKHYHASLSNTLKQLILKWITPLEKELEKQLEMPSSNREDLELKTKHLYAEQSFICRQSSLQSIVMKHLIELKELFEESGQRAPRCYISYAWPSEDRQIQEYWVQPFLFVFYDHLKATGVRMVMDIRDNRPGDSIHLFMQQYYDGNPIILVGTESLLDKHLSVVPHAVQTELSIISNRQGEDRKRLGQTRIYPMLISGTLRSAYPASYQLYSTVRDTRDSNIKEERVELRDTKDQGYIGALRKLIDWIYESRIDQKKSQYIELWRKLDGQLLRLSKDSVAVEAEIALGYHRRRLDHLRQDIQYQSVEAQEEAKHSQAVSTKMIGVLMESIGNNAKTLFDANGQQFQRPYTNPDFVERPVLRNKIIEYFKQDSQVLTLTAHGLGGMGKTELAANYYLHPPRPYTLRAWFHAEKKEQLYHQYINLVAEHPEGPKFPKDMLVEEQARRVKSWLEFQKDCLLVYDNVPNAKEIEQLLPQQGKHHILITSRNEVDWPIHQKLDIDVMEENEAIELIVKITGLEDKEKIKLLVNVLGRLPLALAQAGAYIAVKKINIDEYLKYYREKQSTVLGEITRRHPKHEPVWVTFDMNFEALAKDFPAALLTLKQASWLSHNAIPESLLKMMMDTSVEDKDKLWGDIKENLSLYSLMRIQVEQQQLSIHPLLQDILRSKQGETEQVYIFKQMCHLLNRLIAYYDERGSLEYKVLLSHAERLYEHGQKIINLPIADKSLKLEPMYLGIIYHNMGFFDKSVNFYEKQLEICRTSYDDKSILIAEILSNVGNSYLKLGNTPDGERSCREALTIFEDYYGKNHINTVSVLENLGNAYMDLRQLQQCKEIFERVLSIKEKKYGENSHHLVGILSNLGVLYNEMDVPKNESRILLDRALSIAENYCEKNHPEIARVLINLSNLYFPREALSERKALLERALSIKEGHYGKNHLENCSILANLCIIYCELENYLKGKEYFNKALPLIKARYGENHLEVAKILVNFATCICNDILPSSEVYDNIFLLLNPENLNRSDQLGKLLKRILSKREQGKEAEDLFKKGLEILATYNSKSLHIPGGFKSLDEVKNKYESIKEMNELLKSISSMPIPQFLIDHSHLTIPSVNTINLAEVNKLKSLCLKLNQQGDRLFRAQEYVDALRFFKKALNLQQQVNNDPNKEIATLHFNIGTIHLRQANYQEASIHLQSAYKTRFALLGQNHGDTQKAKERLEECQSKKTSLEQEKTSDADAAVDNSSGQTLFFSDPLSRENGQQRTCSSKDTFSIQKFN